MNRHKNDDSGIAVKMLLAQNFFLKKKNYILSIYTIWDGLSLKTISRYCPFKSVIFSAINFALSASASHRLVR
jgi:hypothetical protein